MDMHSSDRAELGPFTAWPFHRRTLMPRILLPICVAIIAAGCVCILAKADVPVSEYIRMYFEQEGEPYDQPARFRITCYGYRYDAGPEPPTRVPGSYEPEVVYSISGRCPHYGCKIAHELYLNYLHIEYCDLLVDAEDQEYTLSNYASSPMSACEGMECWLRVDLATSAVLRASPEPSPDALPSPAPTAPPMSPTASTDTSPSQFESGDSRTFEETFLIALFLSLLIEVPILCAMVRFAFRLRDIGWPKLLITGVLATALTLPCLWFIAPEVLDAPYALIVGEILVFLVEAAIYALALRIGVRRALLVSFAANLASLVLGAVIL